MRLNDDAGIRYVQVPELAGTLYDSINGGSSFQVLAARRNRSVARNIDCKFPTPPNHTQESLSGDRTLVQWCNETIVVNVGAVLA